MVYIITWIITNVVSVTCPVKYNIDEFGRRTPKDGRYAIQCWDRQETTMKKEFNNKDSAYSFYQRAKYYVDFVQIDSVTMLSSAK